MANVFYRLFKLGRIPKKIRPALESEGIVIADEGVSGWAVSRNFKSPTRRCLYRKEGFLSSLVITQKRIMFHTFAKRQINISTDDPRLKDLRVQLPMPDRLSLSCEASLFHDDWQGKLEFHLRTEKAAEFFNHLKRLGLSTTE